MKKLILVAFATLTGIVVYAQTDSTQIHNPVSVEFKSQAIEKSRRMLLDQFIENNMYGVMTEVNYLMGLDDENYIALYPQEFWLLSYWMKDYTAILKTIATPDSVMIHSKVKRIPPANDYLTTKLIEKSKDKESLLIDDISNAILTKEEKDLLIIALKYLNESLGYIHPKQEELNLLADQFLNNYSSSPYGGFVKKYIRMKMEPTNFGTGYTIHAGTLLLSGNAKEYFKNQTVIGFGVDALHNKWLFQLNVAFAFGKTIADMPVADVTWPTGSKTFGGHIDLAAGYYLLDQHKFSMAPYVSVGLFGLPSNADFEKNPELKEAGIKTNIAGTIGFITDFKLSNKQKNVYSMYWNSVTQTIALRLTYGYLLTPERNKYTDLSGSIHKITLGIAIMSRKNKRVE